MTDYWTNRLTVPVVRAKEFEELSACYQEALKDRGALDCTYKLWSEMTSAEKSKARKKIPSTANNWYVNWLDQHSSLVFVKETPTIQIKSIDFAIKLRNSPPFE